MTQQEAMDKAILGLITCKIKAKNYSTQLKDDDYKNLEAVVATLIGLGFLKCED